jgi:hypothetical protein
VVVTAGGLLRTVWWAEPLAGAPVNFTCRNWVTEASVRRLAHDEIMVIYEDHCKQIERGKRAGSKKARRALSRYVRDALSVSVRPDDLSANYLDKASRLQLAIEDEARDGTLSTTTTARDYEASFASLSDLVARRPPHVPNLSWMHRKALSRLRLDDSIVIGFCDKNLGLFADRRLCLRAARMGQPRRYYRSKFPWYCRCRMTPAAGFLRLAARGARRGAGIAPCAKRTGS